MVLLSFTGQHSVTATDRAAQAGVFFLEFLCLVPVNHQAVIVRELLADLDVAQSCQEYAVAILICFQIGFAGVINPPGGVSAVLGVYDVAVIQVEVEGVVGLVRVVRVDALGFLPGDDLALIFQNHFTGLDGSDSIDTLAVDARFTHLSAAAAGR